MISIGSLFSGIGGLDLGLEWAGLGPVVWQVEQDEWCRGVLARHWPNADRSVTDVARAGRSNLVPVGLICGGFPCQDVSGAGKGKGLREGERSGLWWEFARIVAELRPRFVVVENVASGARRWVCPVRSGLRSLGYRTRALGIRASDVGAPHRRARVFIVAVADRAVPRDVRAAARGEVRDARGRGAGVADTEGSRRPRRGGLGAVDGGRDMVDADGARLEEWRLEQARPEHAPPERAGPARGDVPHAEREEFVEQGRRGGTRGAGAACPPASLCPAEPGMGGVPHGVPARVDRWPAGRGEAQHAWEPPRTAEGVVSRPAKLKALGNAVVPQCAEIAGWVVRAIAEGRA